MEFQAVVLASVSDGDGLYPITEKLPTALLPVANRPLLSFQLELLARSGSFTQVLVLTIERWLPLLSTWVSEQYRGPLVVELLTVPDEAGSADSLRHIRSKLTADFVLLAGDVISDVPFQRMADLHRLQGSAATALFRETLPRDAGVTKKARDLDGIDFVGVDEKGTRVLSLEAAADCDSGVASLSQSLLRAYPHVQLRTDLVDAHVYIFAHWVLDVLDQKPHFSSAKFELLPYLVRKQFLHKSNLPAKFTCRIPDAAEDTGSIGAAGIHAGAVPAGRASALAMSAGKGARRQLTHAAEFRCCCYLLPSSGAYCVRASTIKEYMQANLDVSRESRVTLYEKAAVPPESSSAKEGNLVVKSCDRDSTVGDAVEVASRSVIKKSSIGPHCRIGSNVKARRCGTRIGRHSDQMTNCILMDHVVIHDKVTMQNSIVCGNVEVREGACLKDAQVASGVTIEAGAVHKNETVAAGEREDEGEAED